MQSILYYFRKTGIECQFERKLKKIGIDKNNNIYNTNVEVKRYIIAINNIEYIFEKKISGRPQYILMSESTIIINASSSSSFIEGIDRFFKLKPLEKDIEKEKIKGTTLRMLRRRLKMTPQQLGEVVGKSGLTIIRYEAGSLFLSLNDVAMIVCFTSSIKEFLEMVDTPKKIKIFELEKLKTIIEKSEGMKMSDFLTAEEVAKLCKVKMTKAYKVMKEVNEEMKEKGYMIIRGRVNRKFLYEKLGLEKRDE